MDAAAAKEIIAVTEDNTDEKERQPENGAVRGGMGKGHVGTGTRVVGNGGEGGRGKLRGRAKPPLVLVHGLLKQQYWKSSAVSGSPRMPTVGAAHRYPHSDSGYRGTLSPQARMRYMIEWTDGLSLFQGGV